MLAACHSAFADYAEDKTICASIRKTKIKGVLYFLSRVESSREALHIEEYQWDFDRDGMKDLLRINRSYRYEPVYMLKIQGKKIEKFLEYSRGGRPVRFEGQYYIVSGYPKGMRPEELRVQRDSRQASWISCCMRGRLDVGQPQRTCTIAKAAAFRSRYEMIDTVSSIVRCERQRRHGGVALRLPHPTFALI
jgi:hypothetical protein